MSDRDADDAVALRHLLTTRPTAALATLHRGEPAVSMVPFVLEPTSGSLFIHVSALATHTADMLAHPRVGLLVTAADDAAATPQALPRISLQADAQVLDPVVDAEGHARAKALYLGRFPDAALTFELADFRLVALRPVSARLVAGFARARSLVGEPLRRWLARET